jgi:hypothetical protein
VVGLAALALAASRSDGGSLFRGSASRVVRWPRSSGRTPVPRRSPRGLRGRAPSERARELADARDRARVARLTGDRAVRSTVDWFASLDLRVASLSGDDVVALGVPRGPAVARVLAELRDARLDGTLTSRAMEEEHVRQRIAKGG